MSPHARPAGPALTLLPSPPSCPCSDVLMIAYPRFKNAEEAVMPRSTPPQIVDVSGCEPSMRRFGWRAGVGLPQSVPPATRPPAAGLTSPPATTHPTPSCRHRCMAGGRSGVDERSFEIWLSVDTAAPSPAPSFLFPLLALSCRSLPPLSYSHIITPHHPTVPLPNARRAQRLALAAAACRPLVRQRSSFTHACPLTISPSLARLSESHTGRGMLHNDRQCKTSGANRARLTG